MISAISMPRKAEHVQVILYSKPNCQQCRATMRAFDKHRIAYDYVEDVTLDVDLVESLRERATELGVAGGAPYVSIHASDNTLIADWFGYRPDLIQTHLTSAK